MSPDISRGPLNGKITPNLRTIACYPVLLLVYAIPSFFFYGLLIVYQAFYFPNLNIETWIFPVSFFHTSIPASWNILNLDFVLQYTRDPYPLCIIYVFFEYAIYVFIQVIDKYRVRQSQVKSLLE